MPHGFHGRKCPQACLLCPGRWAASEATWRGCETWVAVNIFPAWPDAAQQELHQAQARADLSHCIRITWWEPLPARAAQPRVLLPPTAAWRSGSCRDRDDMNRIPPTTIKVSTTVKAYFILIFKLGILGPEKVRQADKKGRFIWT